MALELDSLFKKDGPPQVVAEVGANHNRDWHLTLRLLDAIQSAGAAAAKFQSYTADRLYPPRTPVAGYLREKKLVEEGESLFELIRRIELPISWHGPLDQECRKRELTFFSTPFDVESVKLLLELGVPLFKVASTEITHFPLLRAIGDAQRPVVLSTGMASLGEIERALKVIGHDRVVLLQCTVSYPVAAKDVHLRAINTLQTTFGLPVGFSDHTQGNIAAVAALALGARLFEKHVTLDRRLPGPDHPFATEPAELAHYVSSLREAHAALGDGCKGPVEAEREFLNYRPGLFAAVDLPEGSIVSPENLKVLRRPGPGGIDAMEFPRLVGRRLRRARTAGDMFDWQDF